MKILIMGAGGVGGYLAGRLAMNAGDITLIARGAQLSAIAQNGLTVKENGEQFTAHPALVTDDPAKAGPQDAIILCTKSYGLADAMESLRPCIRPDTIILPLLNGISARRMIRETTDTGIVLEGCIYVFSKIAEPGVIEKDGAVCRIVAGNPDGPPPDALVKLCGILEESGVTAEVSADISRVMWMKWLMMVSNAQAASYYNIPIGPMRDDPEKFRLVRALIDECLLVARAEGVNMPEDAAELTIAMIHKFAYHSAPSLSRDLNTPGKPTELSIFAGELVRLADMHGIDAKNNRMILEHFKDRL